MKLPFLIATSVAALVMISAFAQPAAACGWKKYGYYGAAAADVGEVRGYRAHRHYRSHRLYRPYRLYRPVRYWGPGWRRW
jgi:hypothetical protein